VSSKPKSRDCRARIAASVRKTLRKKARRVGLALALLAQLEKFGVVIRPDPDSLDSM
jgi:hypothetical protein